MTVETVAMIAAILEDPNFGVNVMQARLTTDYEWRAVPDVRHVYTSTEDDDVGTRVLVDSPALIVSPDSPPEVEPNVPRGAQAEELRIAIGYAAAAPPGTGNQVVRQALYCCRAIRASILRAFVGTKPSMLHRHGVQMINPVRLVTVPLDMPIDGVDDVRLGAGVFVDLAVRDTFTGG